MEDMSFQAGERFVILSGFVQQCNVFQIEDISFFQKMRMLFKDGQPLFDRDIIFGKELVVLLKETGIRRIQFQRFLHDIQRFSGIFFFIIVSNGKIAVRHCIGSVFLNGSFPLGSGSCVLLFVIE